MDGKASFLAPGITPDCSLQGASFKEMTDANDIRVSAINNLCQSLHLGKRTGSKPPRMPQTLGSGGTRL